MTRDQNLIRLNRGVRAFAFGFSAVLVGLALERAGLSPPLVGLALGIALAAASLTGLAAAALAARYGRRSTLALTGILMAVTGLDLALAAPQALVIGAGVTGMLGAAGIDLGPFASVEQAMLAEAAPPESRNRAFSRYSLGGGIFNALGGLSAVLPAGPRSFFLLYAALGLATAVIPLLMSPRVETDRTQPAFGSPRPLLGLSALFALDSLGGGFVANAVVAYWLHVRFGANPQTLGQVFFGVAILQSLSFELSGRLADRFGLINTMVFTHLPSNALLLVVPLAPNLAWAIGLLLARFALSQMDVPARQAYVVSIVPPAQRAGAVALTGAVRGVAQAFGPPLAGIAIGAAAFGVPFFAGGGLKAVYDLALYAGFRNRPAQHESR